MGTTELPFPPPLVLFLRFLSVDGWTLFAESQHWLLALRRVSVLLVGGQGKPLEHSFLTKIISEKAMYLWG